MQFTTLLFISSLVLFNVVAVPSVQAQNVNEVGQKAISAQLRDTTRPQGCLWLPMLGRRCFP